MKEIGPILRPVRWLDVYVSAMMRWQTVELSMLLLDKATVIKLLSEKSILKSDIFLLQSSSMKHEHNLKNQTPTIFFVDMTRL